MAEFNVKVRLEDKGVNAITAYAYPTLKKRKTSELYIYAPTGFLCKTDKVRLARYTSTTNRWGRDKQKHTVYAGWIRPKYRGDLSHELVYMGLELDERISNAYTECWKLYISYQKTKYYDIAKALFTIMVDNAEYADTGEKIDVDSETFNGEIRNLTDFFGKKLGVCLERNGVQITDYLPFACTLALKKNDKGKLYIQGQALSIFHHPKDLISFRKYMSLKNNEYEVSKQQKNEM